MFEFLFKRPGDKPSDPQTATGPAQAAAAAAASAQAEQTASRRAAQAERAKSLDGDEAAAVELILQSEFADVRLAAAAHVQSQPMLERVQQAMRNTDRRVAKLMQSRLDAIRHQQAEQRQAEASIATARKLLQDEKLTPNLVAELDRLWKVIAATPALAEEFNGVRSALGKRLEDQVALQRAALDALAAVRRLAAGEMPAAFADAAPARVAAAVAPASIVAAAPTIIAAVAPPGPAAEAPAASAAEDTPTADGAANVDSTDNTDAAGSAVITDSAGSTDNPDNHSTGSAVVADSTDSTGNADITVIAGSTDNVDNTAITDSPENADSRAITGNTGSPDNTDSTVITGSTDTAGSSALTDNSAPADSGVLAAPAPSPLEALLDSLAAAHASHVAAPESAALPKHLLSDFDLAMADARAVLAAQVQYQAAFDARRAALAGWQAADAGSLVRDELQRVWLALPRLPDNAQSTALQQAFDAVLASAPVPQKAQKVSAPAPADGAAAPHGKPARKHDGAQARDNAADADANKRFIATLDAMEAALAQGQLHIASDHDKALKESKTGRLTTAQSERLAHVRADLKRLGDWARWGGNVSREELVKAVEDLQGQHLAMAELAKKVGSMRERWKGLDTVSGPAPKSLWERFDAACTAAYAPAAAHFKHLADERHTNAAKAQAMIAEIDAMTVKAAGAEAPDYKGMAAASQRLRQAWSRLGTIDRKEKKKLDGAFGKAMDAMLAPLEEQRRIETARREQLIEETAKLNPAERHTLETLRHLQERWQELAKALPLERKHEQALWQRFRAACDAVFAARKESAHAADSERRNHLHAREAICAQLETATFSGDDKAQQAAIVKILRDAASAWHASGAVPRASEQKIEQRYKAAVAGVQAQADAIKQRAGAAQANALRDKLRLTQALEAALVADDAIDGADWESRWKNLPALGSEYERTLHTRFAAALAAAGGGKRAAYGAQLEAGRARLLQEVLRLEIVAGVDSGAEFARERLKMQVEVLQSSLKSGQKPMTQAAQFLQLCAMPALADARTVSRIEQLFRRIGAAGGDAR